MASNKFLTAALSVAASVSVAAFAGCTAGAPTTPTPTSTPTTPTGTPTPGATPTPGGTEPTATPAPTALPSTPDTSTKATIHGEVYDDLGSKLDGVSVTGQILGAGTFANGSDTLTTTTQVGSYALNGAPTGSTILITVSKSGMTTRQQTIVPLANLQGDTRINNVDFGKGTDRVFALSDKPEITSFTPAKDATGVEPSTSFTLTFNEPVNTADVESLFAIYVSGPIASIASGNLAGEAYTLSTNQHLFHTYDPSKDDGAADSSPEKVRKSASPIYDSASFTPAWSNNNQTVTFTFRPGAKLPTDKDSSKLPQYAVSFKDGSIRDAAGTGRNRDWFRVSPVQVGRQGYKFTVAADTTAPRVSSITPINKSDVAPVPPATIEDRIRVQFSETMALFPGNLSGASIPASGHDGFAAANANFLYYVSTTGTTAYPKAGDAAGQAQVPGEWNFGTPSATEGTQPTGARFYDGDATRATVEFTPTAAPYTAGIGFTTGNNVWVNARSQVIDPAGNQLETSNNINVRSGIAQ